MKKTKEWRQRGRHVDLDNWASKEDFINYIYSLEDRIVQLEEDHAVLMQFADVKRAFTLKALKKGGTK